jgi:type I restriction enzyme M protein
MSRKPPLRHAAVARRLSRGQLNSFLDKTANLLRGGIDHSEFRGYVFALLFYKRLNDVYLEKKLGDPERARHPQRHEFVVPEDCLWDRVARAPEGKLGALLNEALRGIERANRPKLDGILVNPGVDFHAQDRLPPKKLAALVSHFGSQSLSHVCLGDDLFGSAYEYLLRNFASRAGRSSGEFYTPPEVAFLMAEVIEPRPGHHVCDWAAGSGGLLLQCRKYVERRHGRKGADKVSFFLQENNPATAAIARINLLLHGVRDFQQAPAGDSLRAPFFRRGRRLRPFDRVVMNPPFSLESWGYDDFTGGDPHERFRFGLPPRDNGDYAWVQQVVQSLKPTGRAVVVLPQGILFRGQPGQTEAEDGRNQKPDAEHTIRAGLVRADLVEAVIVLPAKLFYGNTVPACLVVLNRRKAPPRRGKVLLVWAARHYQSANPQNLLRRADCLRILVPWRAFGDLRQCLAILPRQEKEMLAYLEQDWEDLPDEMAERERQLVREAAADLRRICSDPHEARRYFAVVDRSAIRENEFNLNVPRYVATAAPDPRIPLAEAVRALDCILQEFGGRAASLKEMLLPFCRAEPEAGHP